MKSIHKALVLGSLLLACASSAEAQNEPITFATPIFKQAADETHAEASPPLSRFQIDTADRSVTTVDFECTDSWCSGDPNGGSCFGGGGARGDQTWVLMATYVWAPAMEGTVGARGFEQPVDLSLSDLFDLISDLNGAFMGHLEVGKGSRGLVLDGMVMQVSPTEPGPLGGTVTLSSNMSIMEGLGMQRLIDRDVNRRHISHVNLDVLGGVRYYQMSNELILDPILGPTVVFDQSHNWVDLVVGVRGNATIAPGLDAFVRSDFGGFGIGSSSNLVWNFVTGVEKQSQKWEGTSFILDYRLLDINQAQGVGAQRFVFDTTMQGPLTAIAFRF